MYAAWHKISCVNTVLVSPAFISCKKCVNKIYLYVNLCRSMHIANSAIKLQTNVTQPGVLESVTDYQLSIKPDARHEDNTCTVSLYHSCFRFSDYKHPS